MHRGEGGGRSAGANIFDKNADANNKAMLKVGRTAPWEPSAIL